MPFVPVPNTYMAEVRYTFDNQQVENTLYFETLTSPSLGEAEQLANALFTWWDTNMKPLQATTLALREIYITDLSADDSFTWTRVSSPPVAGTRVGPAMPNNIALTISFKTAQRGRSFRGRNYVMGSVEGDIINNNFEPAYVTDVQDAYVALHSDIQAMDLVWVVVSRFSNGLPRVTGVTTPIITFGVFDGIVDSQRRRLPGRGI